MTHLLIVLTALLLVACSNGYTRDGVTVMSYCLLGGVYVDDTKTTLDHETKPQQCDLSKE